MKWNNKTNVVKVNANGWNNVNDKNYIGFEIINQQYFAELAESKKFEFDIFQT